VSTGTNAEIQTYLEQLRRELSDLPDAEVEEIIQDLEPQLAEMADELDTSLSERLGTPAEYARELRTAAGLGERAVQRLSLRPPLVRSPSVWMVRIVTYALAVSTVVAGVSGLLSTGLANGDVRAGMGSLGYALIASLVAVCVCRPTAHEVTALPEVRTLMSWLASKPRVIPYLKSLRPGWFLVQTVLVVFGGLWLCYRLSWLGTLTSGAVLVFAVVAVVAGHRVVADRRWLWLSVPLTGWTVGTFIGIAELLPQVYAAFPGYY
jgi:uncharacterized membrane protein